MTDTTQDLPLDGPEAAFGCVHVRSGEELARGGLGRGWWLLPMLAGGIALWILLFRILLF